MRVHRLCLTILACLALSFGVFVQAVSAQTVPYDSGPYGRCTYSIGCPQHTIITTPSGLDVAVNLTNGQVIPAKGYTIVVTPLNGSGSSFKTVDFYIDSQLAHSMPPAEDGTASWFWDPRVYPGTAVKIVVTDTDGQTVTKNFQVTFTKATTGQNGPGNGAYGNGGYANSGSGDNSGGGLNSSAGVITPFIGSSIVPASVKHLIQHLPGPIVYAFPYLLFILLGVEALLLLRQTKREVNERRTLERLIARERQVAELKQTFLQLVSHYLRTPLTILRSGAEGLPSDGVPADTAAPVQQEIERLRGSIEAFVTRIDSGAVTASSQPVTPSLTTTLGQHQTGRILAIWLPVFLVGVIAFFFTYAAGHITRFSSNAIEGIIQFLVFAVLAGAIYQLLRNLQLHRRDRLNTKAVRAEEQAAVADRDQVADEASAAFQAQLASLGDLIAKLPQTTNSNFVRKGFSQLKNTYGKFTIASHLKGGHSDDRYTPASLKSLYEQASASVAENAQKKHLTLSLEGDLTLSVQNASLLALILESLLENAIAYSAENGSITVSGTNDGKQATITVTDHGQGIPPAKLAELFQPFSKVEGAETFNHEGMGFSLYLDRLIMAYLSGDIQLKSEPGKATAATFRWPLPA